MSSTNNAGNNYLTSPFFWYDVYQNADTIKSIASNPNFWNPYYPIQSMVSAANSSIDALNAVGSGGQIQTQSTIEYTIPDFSSVGFKNVNPNYTYLGVKYPTTLKFDNTKPNSVLSKYDSSKPTPISDCVNNCLNDGNCSGISFDTPKVINGVYTANCILFTPTGTQTTSNSTDNQFYTSYLYVGPDNSKTTKNDFQLQTQNNHPNTMCRGNGWTDNNGPFYHGKIKSSQCENICRYDSKCKAFDISRPDSSGNFDCYTFRHNDSSQIQGQVGDITNAGCYKKIDITSQDGLTHDDYELMPDLNNGKSARTMCRGTDWDKNAPQFKGYKTLNDCAQLCQDNRSCKAFDIARVNNNTDTYSCYNFNYNSLTDKIPDYKVTGVDPNNNENNGCFKKLRQFNRPS